MPFLLASIVEEANKAFELNTALFTAIQMAVTSVVPEAITIPKEDLLKKTYAFSQVTTAMIARTSRLNFSVVWDKLTLVCSLPGSFATCYRRWFHRGQWLLGPPGSQELGLYTSWPAPLIFIFRVVPSIRSVTLIQLSPLMFACTVSPYLNIRSHLINEPIVIPWS